MTINEVFEKWTVGEIMDDINKGGKFVIFTYCISLVVVTFRRPSDIYYIKSDELTISHGFKYMLLSLILGWWGLPHGPLYTIQSIWYAFFGKNITEEIMADVMQNLQESTDYAHNESNPPTYNIDALLQS